MGPPGHFGIGFAAKSTALNAPLWVYLLASETLDLLSFVLEAVGIEKFAVSEMDFKEGIRILVPGSVPWSHGLFMSVVWSVLFAAIAYLVYKDRKTSAVLGLVVFSHWVLDFIVHPPDLHLLFNDSLEVGLGLWASGPGFIASIILELFLFAAGITIYGISRRRKIVKGLEK
jgi:hypothetical protein